MVAAVGGSLENKDAQEAADAKSLAGIAATKTTAGVLVPPGEWVLPSKRTTDPDS